MHSVFQDEQLNKSPKRDTTQAVNQQQDTDFIYVSQISDEKNKNNLKKLSNENQKSQQSPTLQPVSLFQSKQLKSKFPARGQTNSEGIDYGQQTQKDYKLSRNMYSSIYFNNYLFGQEKKVLLAKIFFIQIVLLILLEVLMLQPKGQMDQSISFRYLITRIFMILILINTLDNQLNNGITILQHSKIYSVFSKHKQTRDKVFGMLIGASQIMVALFGYIVGYQLISKHSNQATVIYNYLTVLAICNLDKVVDNCNPRMEVQADRQCEYVLGIRWTQVDENQTTNITFIIKYCLLFVFLTDLFTQFYFIDTN